jgi:hypothetical protein
MKKTIELQANTSTPPGATIRLTVEYRSKIKQFFVFFQSKFKENIVLYTCVI